MSIFRKFRTLPVPEECKGFDIKTESSACTGEKTVGFYNPLTKKLMYSELVRTDEDIEAFYSKYRLKRN